MTAKAAAMWLFVKLLRTLVNSIVKKPDFTDHFRLEPVTAEFVDVVDSSLIQRGRGSAQTIPAVGLEYSILCSLRLYRVHCLVKIRYKKASLDEHQFNAVANVLPDYTKPNSLAHCGKGQKQ